MVAFTEECAKEIQVGITRSSRKSVCVVFEAAKCSGGRNTKGVKVSKGNAQPHQRHLAFCEARFSSRIAHMDRAQTRGYGEDQPPALQSERGRDRLLAVAQRLLSECSMPFWR
jgi:hypothetical protein